MPQGGEKHIYFSEVIGCCGWWWGTTTDQVRFQVEGWAAYDGGTASDAELPELLVLHFPACKGGDVVEGYGLFNYLRGLAARGVKLEARIEGLCASIATLVALACDAVLMADAALWMVHKPTMPTDGGSYNADELAAAAVLLDKIQAQIVSRYVARCGGKLDAATATDLVNKESWLTADECLAFGFVTGKLHEEPLVAPTGAEAVLNYFPHTTKPANTMAISAAEKKGIVDEVIAGIKNFLGVKPKNEAEGATPPPAPQNAATSIDVTGGDPIYFDGTELAEGTAVYSDEAMTTAYADGDYTLADGRDVTISSGTVESLTDATADDKAANEADAALAAENEAVKAENALLKRKLDAANNKLKTHVPGSAGNPTPPGAGNSILKKAGASGAKNALPISFTPS